MAAADDGEFSTFSCVRSRGRRERGPLRGAFWKEVQCGEAPVCLEWNRGGTGTAHLTQVSCSRGSPGGHIINEDEGSGAPFLRATAVVGHRPCIRLPIPVGDLP